MSDGYQIANQNAPRLDPNAPPSPTGNTGSYTSGSYNYSGTSKGVTIGAGKTASSTSASKNSNTITLPNGISVTIPYHGWYYNIAIPNPPLSQEKVKAEKKDDRDGCDCVKCKEFYPFAEPNQEDGTLICFSCRNGY